MDQAAEGSPRYRKVRCPECKTGLLQPAGSPIFECSVCSTLLKAKGPRHNFQGESWRISLNENGQGIEVSQEMKELEAKSVSGSEVSRAQGQDELDNHEVNADRSMNGHQEEVLIPVTNESVLVLENEMEQELQFQSNVVNGSTSGVGDLDTASDYAIRRSTAIVMESMAMEMQHPLDSVSDGPSASITGNKPQAAHDHMNIQEIVSNGVERTVVQSPLEDAQNCDLSSASRVENAFVGECEAMEGKNHTECDTSANGNVLVTECEGMKRNNHKECNTLDVGNVFVGEGEGAEGKNHKRCGTSADERVFVDEREGVEGKNHKECGTLVDGNVYVGDGEGMEGVEGKNHKGCGSLDDGNVLVGECEGVEGKNHKECNNVANGNDRAFESEIIRDNECELSFKYIAALESEESNKPLHAYFPERFPSSSDENSDESESYSSVSDSASHDGLDSDFDFPAPLAENMLPAKLTDSFLLQKMPSPSDVPEPPHQLEWQDVYYDNEESTFQDSNGAIISSAGVVDKVVSDGLTMVEQEDQVEIAEVGPHIQKENLMKRKTVLQGHGDTVATINETSHAQRDKCYSGLGGLANTVGFVALEGGVKNVALNDTAGTENGYPGTLSYQLNERKPLLSNDSRDEVSKSQEVLSSGAGHPLKLKPRCTLNEGNLNTNTLCLGKEASTSSLSGGSKEETCLAVQENIQLIERVAIISPKDSAATSSSDYTGDDIGNHSKIASQIISIQKTWEKRSDLSHPEHDMLMTITNSQTGRAAPHSDYASKRDVQNVDLARNKEPESAGMQPSLHIEQGNLSSHSAGNMFDSRLHSIRNYLSEETQVHNRENALSVFNSQLHHKRNYPSEERQMHNVKGSKHASQVQQSIHNEGLGVPRATRTLEGAPETRQRFVQADCGIADGQGPLPQKQNWQADVHMMKQTRNHPGHVKDVHGHSPVTSQPFGYTNYDTESDVFARGVPSANKAPSHPLMVPIAMQGHGCSHRGCHPVPPVCMACIHCQHAHYRQPMPPCGLCLSQSLLMAYQQGHPELWNYHHIHQVQGPDQGVSVVHCPPTCISSQTVHMHGTATAAAKPLVSSVRKPKHYPPLPQGSVAPYVICKCCDEIMHMPADLPLSDQVVQKLRCGACRTVSKFSVLKGTQETSLPCNVGLQSSAVKSTSSASTSFSPSVQYTTKDSRQLPVSTVTQIMESSYHQALYSKHPQAAVNSQLQNGGGVVPASINRRFSEDEIIFKNQSKQGAPDTEITPAITDQHSSQDEFFFRSLSGQCEFDSSRNWFKTSLSAMGTIERTKEALIVGNDPSLQASMDEKEEGLDFGAPRMSDGESLGQRSPESRKISLENKRDFQVMEQNRYREGSFGGEASWMTENTQHEVVELKQDDIAQKGKSRASLIALLSQESTKFELNIEERVSFEESRSALWSTATNSPVREDHTDQGFLKRDTDIGQRRNLRAHHFVRKGPRYIAGMLRRSLKDFHKGIQ